MRHCTSADSTELPPQCRGSSALGIGTYLQSLVWCSIFRSISVILRVTGCLNSNARSKIRSDCIFYIQIRITNLNLWYRILFEFYLPYVYRCRIQQRKCWARPCYGACSIRDMQETTSMPIRIRRPCQDVGLVPIKDHGPRGHSNRVASGRETLGVAARGVRIPNVRGSLPSNGPITFRIASARLDFSTCDATVEVRANYSERVGREQTNDGILPSPSSSRSDNNCRSYGAARVPGPRGSPALICPVRR